MTSEIKLKPKKSWVFEYKGITCEVVNWNFDKPMDEWPSGNWNGYIIIKAKQLPEKFKELLCKKRKTIWKSMPWMWEYYKLDQVFNMKGGITFYEVIKDQYSNDTVAIKVGNDYQHSWDVDHYYNVIDVVFDLKQSVDSFIEKYPDYLVWNRIDGSYIKPTEENAQS